MARVTKAQLEEKVKELESKVKELTPTMDYKALYNGRVGEVRSAKAEKTKMAKKLAKVEELLKEQEKGHADTIAELNVATYDLEEIATDLSTKLSDAQDNVRVLSADITELQKTQGETIHKLTQELVAATLVPVTTTVYPMTLRTRDWFEDIKAIHGNKVYWTSYILTMLVVFLVLMSSAFGIATVLSFGSVFMTKVLFHITSIVFFLVYGYSFGVIRNWWRPLMWKED